MTLCILLMLFVFQGCGVGSGGGSGDTVPTVVTMTIPGPTLMTMAGPPKRCFLSPCPALKVEAHIDMHDRIETLRDITHAYYEGCYETVIAYGTKDQTDYGYKTFSVLKKARNIFLPDGMLIDYVLESYERGFVTVLLVASYSNSDNPEAVNWNCGGWPTKSSPRCIDTAWIRSIRSSARSCGKCLWNHDEAWVPVLKL